MSTTSNEIVQSTAPALYAETFKQLPTVLLVEDDRSVRRYLEVILRRAGYAVIPAADGLEALKAALSSTVDAVVTDMFMPHLNGQELCRFLRRHPKLAALPIVLLSGVERPDLPGENDERADAYLAKPVRPADLTGCIARLLSQAGWTRTDSSPLAQ
jgi:CheY-like chemotaxis protein